MSCALTGSFSLDCRDSFGGIREIKVKVHPGNVTNTTVTSGVITASGDYLNTWYTYGVEKDTCRISDNPQTNVQNGTVFYQQEVQIIVNKLRAAFRNELVLLAQNSLLIAVRDNNDNYWLLGYQRGLDLQPSTSGSGTASGDRSGYDLLFAAPEHAPMLSMSSATYDTLITA